MSNDVFGATVILMAVASTSSPSALRGFCTAITLKSLTCNSAITSRQLVPSPHARWTINSVN